MVYLGPLQHFLQMPSCVGYRKPVETNFQEHIGRGADNQRVVLGEHASPVVINLFCEALGEVIPTVRVFQSIGDLFSFQIPVSLCNLILGDLSLSLGKGLLDLIHDFRETGISLALDDSILFQTFLNQFLHGAESISFLGECCPNLTLGK